MQLTGPVLALVLLVTAAACTPSAPAASVPASTNGTAVAVLTPVAFEDAGSKAHIAPKAAGGFSFTCWNTQLVGSGNSLSLAAICGNGNGGNNGWTYLPINNCIANINGVLVCARNGNALHSCAGCQLEADYHNRMDCKCYRSNGSSVWVTAYLDDCITNYYGNLIC